MSAYTTSLAGTNATDADFRAWGLWMSDRLTDMGVTKTGDTGQIDWATVTAPSVANTAQGYEIRQLTDALSGANPVLVKIEFGGGAAANRPSIWTTVGTASDGAGNLTGGISNRQQTQVSGISAALTCIASGASNRFGFAMFISGTTSNSLWISLERSHDGDGADTAEAVLRAGNTTAGNNPFQQAYLLGIANTVVETVLGALLPTVGTGSDGTDIALYPVFMTKGPFLNPCSNFMMAFNANITPGTPITFPFYGADKTYYPIGSAFLSPLTGRTLANAATLLLRYE